LNFKVELWLFSGAGPRAESKRPLSQLAIVTDNLARFAGESTPYQLHQRDPIGSPLGGHSSWVRLVSWLPDGTRSPVAAMTRQFAYGKLLQASEPQDDLILD